MIGDLKPYPKMKGSGVPWLGDVPEHWEEVPLKRFARFDNSGSYGVEPEQERYVIPVATTAQISWDGYFAVERMPKRGFSDKDIKKYICRPGDILVVKSSGSIFNVISGKAGLVRKSTPDFVFSNFLLRVLPDGTQVNPEYLFHLLSGHLTRERVKRMVAGTTYPNLRVDEYTAALLPLPPLPEQAAIVRFLDYMDRRIRRYIRAKQKLIGLLAEQKKAIIHRAVTRGLDPDVPLKPSGVEWLGDVPEHWEVRRAKYFYREVDERSTTGSEKLMSVSHKTGVTPRKKGVTMFLAESNVGHKICRAGDLAINTMWAYMAALGVARELGIVSPSYGVYRSHDPEQLMPDYIDCLLRTEGYKSEYLCRSTGITSSRLRLYPEEFLKIPILCPPSSEQVAIVTHFEDATTELQTAIEQTEREIELLREYRTRLIADVVTGKLDVRKASANLPDESDDGIPLEEDDELSDAVDETDIVEEVEV